MAKRFQVIWSPSAALDFEEILLWVEEERPGRAIKIHGRLETAAARLEHDPERGRIVPELRDLGIRFLRELIVSPWRLVYRIEGNHVHVVTVFDGRRDPAEMLMRRLLRESK